MTLAFRADHADRLGPWLCGGHVDGVDVQDHPAVVGHLGQLPPSSEASAEMALFRNPGLGNLHFYPNLLIINDL